MNRVQDSGKTTTDVRCSDVVCEESIEKIGRRRKENATLRCMCGVTMLNIIIHEITKWTTKVGDI